MSATIPVVVRPQDCCSTSCDNPVVSQVPGPQGPPGEPCTPCEDGIDAFTATTAGFTMPAVGNTVNVAVAVSDWAGINQIVYIEGAGYFRVSAVPDTTHITVLNLGYTGNAAPAVIIGSAKKVSPGGLQGPTGSSAGITLNSISPTTTKGDLIVDNGGNSPSAGDVRLARGTDGQLLTSVAAQPTGLQWQSLLPNATTDNGIPRFNGAAATPVPLQTSLMLISDTGAIQSTPSGGNARGTSATDLQVIRSAGTEVASGDSSVITGGENNTASGDLSCVNGGADNDAQSDYSSISGGQTNTCSGTNSAISGGTSNATSGNQSCIAGGSSNVASGDNSFIGGGNTNTASNTGSMVSGGQDNTSSGIYSLASGNSALADKLGQVAQASGKFSALGDAQASTMTLFGVTANVTPTEIFLDNSGARMSIPSDTTWAFRMLIVARRTDVDDESAAYQLLGCIDRNGAVGTTALVGTVSKTVIAEDTAAWDVAATADAVNGALILTVTGENAKTIRWVCKTELTQVSG